MTLCRFSWSDICRWSALQNGAICDIHANRKVYVCHLPSPISSRVCVCYGCQGVWVYGCAPGVPIATAARGVRVLFGRKYTQHSSVWFLSPTPDSESSDPKNLSTGKICVRVECET